MNKIAALAFRAMLASLEALVYTPSPSSPPTAGNDRIVKSLALIFLAFCGSKELWIAFGKAITNCPEANLGLIELRINEQILNKIYTSLKSASKAMLNFLYDTAIHPFVNWLNDEGEQSSPSPPSNAAV